MNDASKAGDSGELARELRVFELCRQFEEDWAAGRRLPVEEALQRGLEDDGELALEQLIASEYELRCEAAERPDPIEYLRRFPEQKDIVRRALERIPDVRLPTDQWEGKPIPAEATPRQEGETLVDEEYELPLNIGKYEFVRKLGGGGFGIVGQYFDKQMPRNVAIKIPRKRTTDLDQFFQEAADQAALEIRGVVPIYHVEREANPPYIVMKFMAGGELTALTRGSHSSWDRIVELVSEVAETLDKIHRRGFIHRDLKPPNVLLDEEGHPHIADLGLVMHVSIREKLRGQIAGSKAFMSPEQLRCEDLDARSDLWSLGVILYQLLTAEHPFHRSGSSVSQAILSGEPLEPRNYNSQIPAELQRICLRLLERRRDDRYDSASQLVDELRTWRDAERDRSTEFEPSGVRPTLESFQSDQAKEFLDLLPGPRERDGTPTSVHFWKSRIESREPGRAFPIGVLYGKSGSGKSSFLRAGLAPRLPNRVTTVLVEATAEDTEVRLLKALRHEYPALTDELDLVQSLTLLREELIPDENKLLLVVDQFEQWLHVWQGGPDDQLPAALRQCDGVRLQCLLSIRDDFWLSVTRLMREVGVRLRERDNTLAVDLFDRRHAAKVLHRYGRALDAIHPEPTSDEQAFIERALNQLGEEQGRIVCVRLVMFAQMMASREWSTQALDDLGGLDELGVKFLDEMISGESAPPHRRLHAQALDCVLAELVPLRGVDIKARMRSKEQLQAACPTNYQRAPDQFEEVLDILQNETRLISPTEPDQSQAGDIGAKNYDKQASDGGKTSECFYQLTHDYLVVPLRERRIRTLGNTLWGRAQLRLRELGDLWDFQRPRQFLPAWWEDIMLRLFTSSKKWSEAERCVMRASGWRHATRAAAVLFLLLTLSFVIYQVSDRYLDHLGQQHEVDLANEQLTNLLNTELPALDDALRQLRPRSPFVKDQLLQAASDPHAANDPSDAVFRNALVASVILLEDSAPWTDGRLLELLLHSPVSELEQLRRLLMKHVESDMRGFEQNLWQTVTSDAETESRRVRAAALLAAMSGLEDKRWQEVAEPLANDIVAATLQNPADFDNLSRMFAPLAATLREPLKETAVAEKPGNPTSGKALDLLRVFARDDLPLMVDTSLQLAPSQLSSTLALDLERIDESAMELENKLADESIGVNKRATAAALLMRLGRTEKVWPLFHHGEDPTLRNLLIHRIVLLEVDPNVLLGRLEKHQQDDVLEALLLALGEYSPERLPKSTELEAPWSEIAEVAQQWRENPTANAALRSAAEWLLRTWNVPLQPRRNVVVNLKDFVPPDHLQRFEGPEGHSFVVLKMGSFEMGSPRDQKPRDDDERPHTRVIQRRLAVATKEVTRAQFERFVAATVRPQAVFSLVSRVRDIAPDPNCPMVSATWSNAARYCNWLSKQAELLSFYEEVPIDGTTQSRLRPRNENVRTFRLPTEAEWEFAARSMTTTRYHFGDDAELIGEYAWYIENSDERTRLVGTRKPNHFGLFDMHGNVIEWCHDRYGGYPRAAGVQARDEIDLQEYTPNDDRVLRGGGFNQFAKFARSANRVKDKPNQPPPAAGFRIVLVLP